MTPQEMKERLQEKQSKLILIAAEAMLSKEADITALVVDQQYDKGISGDGSPLGGYSDGYRKRKQRDGIFRGFTDFHLTGEMHANMKLEVNPDSDTYRIYSEREVSGYLLSDLLKKRDVKSFELTEESKQIVKEMINPVIIEMLKQE
jgi:hypothetical protein